MKYGQKLKLGDAHVTPRNIQQVQASRLGDARASPSSSTKISGHLSIRYIFIASYNMCYSWSVFIFSVLFCFFFCNKWLDPIIRVLEETHSVLIAQNTLVFTFIVPLVFQFASTSFSSGFSLLLCSELVQFSLFQYVQLSNFC